MYKFLATFSSPGGGGGGGGTGAPGPKPGGPGGRPRGPGPKPGGPAKREKMVKFEQKKPGFFERVKAGAMKLGRAIRARFAG